MHGYGDEQVFETTWVSYWAIGLSSLNDASFLALISNTLLFSSSFHSGDNWIHRPRLSMKDDLRSSCSLNW